MIEQNGAESLVTTLAASQVELCFANPGTSEMHFVAALDRIPGVRCVLALFEGVATGAADGYWRMAEKPAATLLHLGPGLGNGWANLHNARKARSGIVNVVGDHATGHVHFESPLKSDLNGIAQSISHWVRSSQRAADVGADGAAAVQATRDGAVGRIATLVLPADTAWGAGGQAHQAAQPAAPQAVPQAAVDAAAQMLKSMGARAMLLLGAAGSRDERSQMLAAAIAAKTGCKLMAEFYNARMPGGRSRPRIPRLPYAVDPSVAALAGVQALVLAGSVDPIGFFAYPGKPSQLKPPGAALLTLAEPRQDVPAALQALADALDVRVEMYTLQALWTMARESLPVVAVVFANSRYAILQGELQGVGAQISGQKAVDMLTLDRPNLDWVALAKGHGVAAVRVEDAGALVQALQRGFASQAPCLIEVVI